MRQRAWGCRADGQGDVRVESLDPGIVEQLLVRWVFGLHWQNSET